MGQKTEFIFEVEETITLKQGGKLLAGHCPKCCDITEMVTPDVIALATGMREREIFRLIEAGLIQSVEFERLYACTGCLANLDVDAEVRGPERD